nr:MAG TPA: hypothetical protein [Caudoviricetes sp.]
MVHTLCKMNTTKAPPVSTLKTHQWGFCRNSIFYMG